MLELNNLERDVMAAILTGGEAEFRTLLAQFSVAVIRDREFTGVGFFTTFIVPPEAPRLDDRGLVHVGNVVAEINGIKDAAGFVLHIQDGCLQSLEGYTFGEAWPSDIHEFRVKKLP